MPQNKLLRYEKKYLISVGQAEQLAVWLDSLCYRDKNLKEQKMYNIRSLYFDDYFRSSYYDNEIGIEPRTKYRIRIYNCEDNYISLEQKNKIAGKIYKERAKITKDIFYAIINDEMEQIEFSNESSLINQFLTAYYIRDIRPKVIVDYDREAYVYPEGDVRITFDRNIAFSDCYDEFFDRQLFLQPILPVGMQLLEVKYTEFLPEFIYQRLNSLNLQQVTFSKYYLCEKYKGMGEK